MRLLVHLSTGKQAATPRHDLPLVCLRLNLVPTRRTHAEHGSPANHSRATSIARRASIESAPEPWPFSGRVQTSCIAAFASDAALTRLSISPGIPAAL